MEINVTTNSALSAADGGKQSETGNTAEFLKLLMANISNQNPLDPVNNEEVMSLIAEYSSLDELIKINTGIGTLESHFTKQGPIGDQSMKEEGSE